MTRPSPAFLPFHTLAWTGSYFWCATPVRISLRGRRFVRPVVAA